MNSDVIEFSNFSFQYRAQVEPTLFDINLKIRRGEKILIAGPSGCGKSTLAHCINGLIPNAYAGTMRGALRICGVEAFNQDIFTRSKTVGTVLQDTDGQFVGLTAAEDIAFAAENNRVPVEEMREKVREAAALTLIDGHLAKAPQNLSGGQKQRVSLAGLLMDDVDILLFDEPLANLDPATGAAAIELIDKLRNDTGKTIIIIEHRMEDVLHRAVDRIVVIQAGRIAADMPPAELLTRKDRDAAGRTILDAAGVREPLYLSALRLAGCEPEASDKPESVDTVRFDAGKLGSWNDASAVKGCDSRGGELLDVSDLGFAYEEGGAPVLQDVTFMIRERESVAIAGRNGAGKSTLAKLICGFIKPTRGVMRFRGEDMTRLSIRERSERVGFVMQNPNQMISFPMIYDETAFALRNRGMNESEIKIRVEEALTICGLIRFRKWPVSALSYGQKKRLTIASILVMRPELLLLDEPTAGQDYHHYTDIMEFLKKLNKENGITLVMITHDMHLMLEYTDRALVVADGKLLRSAAPAEVLTDNELIAAASLKKTSLYDLAARANINDSAAFVQRFIEEERARRERMPS